VPDVDRAVEAQLERFHPGTAPSFDVVLARRRRQDVRRRALGASAAVALGVTALGAGPALLDRAAPDESPAASAPAAGRGAPQSDLRPSRLVGSWRVSGGGETPSAVLRLSPRRLTLRQPCGKMSGVWSAGPDGVFAAQIGSGSGGCLRGMSSFTSAPGHWLADVIRFRADGERRILVDAQDRPVATLLPVESGSASLPAESSAEDGDVMDVVSALPGPGLQPVAPEQVAGRWVPVGEPRGTRAFLRLADDRSWKASHSCTGTGGLWSAGELGRIEAVGAYAIPLVGCLQPATSVSDWLLEADRLALDGDVLVLLDAAGNPIGRLERAAPQ